MSDVRTGRCLCGAVRLEAEIEGHEFGACHCAMCRRWSGGAPFFAVEAKTRLLEGADRVATYRSSEWAERAFCSVCGTNLWYRLAASDPASGEVILAEGVLENADDMTLGSEIFIDEKPAGYEFAGARSRLTGAEVFAMFAQGGAGEDRGTDGG